MTALVECIPNISEGISPRRIDFLAEPLRRTPGVALLHVHSDADHHRTVYTAVGPPAGMLEALLELYRRAVAEIDLRQHRGVHPRLGAVDVCPFVPLPAHGTEMTDCVALARTLAETVADELGLPVILYGASAADPSRADLTDIRRGQFEGLTAKLARPQWAPDFGPAAPHVTAGATVIGARGPLVAYNVVLDRLDLAAARRIAARVRESSGGLPGVKAMGVPLHSRGLAQVSLNLVRPETTAVHVAVEAVRREAAAESIGVLETEVVGLMPLESVAAAAAHQLQLPSLPVELVLEEAIARAFRSG